MEILLQYGNAFVIAYVASQQDVTVQKDMAAQKSVDVQQGAYETCSFLPLSEKQIQLTYQEIQKKCELPPILCLTEPDPVSNISSANKGGLLFYAPRSCAASMHDLIAKHGLIAKIHKNIAKFAMTGQAVDCTIQTEGCVQQTATVSSHFIATAQ